MLDWLKSWIKTSKVVIYVDRVEFPCGGCGNKLSAPLRPTLYSSHGDSVIMIKFPVTVAPGTDPDIASTTVFSQVDGDAAASVVIDGNGGDTFVTVPDGSSGDVWPCTLIVLATSAQKAPRPGSRTPAIPRLQQPLLVPQFLVPVKRYSAR